MLMMLGVAVPPQFYEIYIHIPQYSRNYYVGYDEQSLYAQVYGTLLLCILYILYILCNPPLHMYLYSNDTLSDQKILGNLPYMCVYILLCIDLLHVYGSTRHDREGQPSERKKDE